MKKEIPEIGLRKQAILNVEVKSFTELYALLSKSKTHNAFAPHKIKFFLILVVTKNDYTHYVDFKSYNLKQGSSLFIAKNQVHHYNRDLKNVKGYAMVFNHLFVDKHYFLSDNFRLNRLFNYHIESPIIHQKEIGENSVVELIAELYRECNSENLFAKSEILAALLRLVLLKAERAKERLTTSNVTSRYLETFSDFKDILEIEYVNSRNSKIYAAKLFVSYKFLNNVVKKMTGITVKAFIDNFVNTEIKRYLISTSLSVNEISYKIGFEDPAYMIKFFKKNASITPLKFRQQL